MKFAAVMWAFNAVMCAMSACVLAGRGETGPALVFVAYTLIALVLVYVVVE